MKNLTFFLFLCLPLACFSQKKSWHIGLESGFNLSFNRMTTIMGSEEFLDHKKPVFGGYWGLNGAYQFSSKTALIFGVDHVAYKLNYKYGKFRGPSTQVQAQIYVWGFPIGIENYWLVDRKFELVTGYGLKYRINKFAMGTTSDRQSNVVDNDGNVIEVFRHRDFDYTQNDHMLALFAYMQFIYKIKPFLHLGVKLTYNQGLTVHESFQLETSYTYPQENRKEENNFLYESKVSYFSAGITIKYIFLKKENKTIKL